jgi:organic hydroperoxide reductase OsmC/OhrA
MNTKFRNSAAPVNMDSQTTSARTRTNFFPFAVIHVNSFEKGNMSEHKATIRWQRTSPDFLRGKYSREHTWTFDGGLTVPASSSPAVVPTPWSNPAHVDPEEAFVASVSSCHMLTYLFLAAKQGFQIDSYEDEAVGSMSKNEHGVPWISTIALNPKIIYGGEKTPAAADEARLHHMAHEQCFIANSIKTVVTVNGGHH